MGGNKWSGAFYQQVWLCCQWKANVTIVQFFRQINKYKLQSCDKTYWQVVARAGMVAHIRFTNKCQIQKWKAVFCDICRWKSPSRALPVMSRWPWPFCLRGTGSANRLWKGDAQTPFLRIHSDFWHVPSFYFSRFCVLCREDVRTASYTAVGDVTCLVIDREWEEIFVSFVRRKYRV